MPTAHATSTIAGALARTLIGLGAFYLSGGKIKVKHAFKGHNSYQCSHHHETNGRFVCSCRTWSTTEKAQYFVQYGKQQ